MLAPAASVVGPQLSVWVGAPFPTLRASDLFEAIDQLTPLPPGSGSLIVTPVAVPGPLLVSVTWKPIVSPALTLAASAAFVSVRLAHRTAVEAEASPAPSLLVEKLAVLL